MARAREYIVMSKKIQRVISTQLSEYHSPIPISLYSLYFLLEIDSVWELSVTKNREKLIDYRQGHVSERRHTFDNEVSALQKMPALLITSEHLCSTPTCFTCTIMKNGGWS